MLPLKTNKLNGVKKATLDITPYGVIIYDTFWCYLILMEQQIQQSFRALGDPTRREILMQLSQEDLTIAEVSDRFDMSRTAVRKHLTILEEGQLIIVKVRGKERVNQLNPQGLKNTAEWFNYFNQFWDSALDSLKNTIERDSQQKQTGE